MAKIKRFFLVVVLLVVPLFSTGCGNGWDDNNIVIKVECSILPDHPSCD